MIDIHSHILPGIDDGARTLADSVEMVRELQDQGIEKVIATPHYMLETNYISARSHNAKLLSELKRALKKADIKVGVYLGNEIYIDQQILQLVKQREIASMSNSKYILVELPLSGEYPNAEDILLDLMAAGYKVILAHPERYAIMQKDFDRLVDWHQKGILFQCNMGSIVGRYGKKAKKTVKKLIKAKMVFAFGSDIHRPSRQPDRILRAKQKLAKYYSEAELAQVLVKNPQQITG